MTGVEPWRRGLVVLSASAAGLATVWLALVTRPPTGAFLFGSWAVITLLPLLVRDRGAFGVLCGLLGAFLALVGVPLYVLGLIGYAPAALVLLLAGVAGVRPVARAVVGAVALAFGVAQVLWWVALIAQDLGSG